MLSVQKPPRMGSSSQPPSDPFLSSEYPNDLNVEPLFEPPEPAPGAPLLTDTDSKFLLSFFNDISANNYDAPSYGEGLNFNDAWLGLPPTFMGSTTSFGQQAGSSMQSPSIAGYTVNDLDPSSVMSSSQLMPPPPQPNLSQNSYNRHSQQSQRLPQHQQQQRHHHHHNQQQQQQPYPSQHHEPSRQYSDDVLSAAATLLQNGADPSRSPRGPSDPVSQRRPVGPPVGHLRHQAMNEFKQEQRQGGHDGELDNTFTEWMFGPQQRQSLRRAPATDLQWGSDANFTSTQGYRAKPSSDNVETHHAEQMKFLEGLDLSHSTETTRQNSPSASGTPAARSTQTAKTSGPLAPGKSPEEVGGPPRKRRKSKVTRRQSHAEESGDTRPAKTAPAANFKKANGASHKNAERQQRASSPHEADADFGTTGKRKKATAAASSSLLSSSSSSNATAAAKAPRENLTEEQKRENHIRSEQKRRTLIKEGFEDLCELVPGLRGGGFSKSTMLTMAAEWLEELLEGNRELEAQLAGGVKGR